MAPRTNGNPVMEVYRENLDGYRLVSLTLAAGENLPDPATLPDIRDRRNKPGVPVHIYMGHIDGTLIQFWYTDEKLTASPVERGGRMHRPMWTTLRRYSSNCVNGMRVG